MNNRTLNLLPADAMLSGATTELRRFNESCITADYLNWLNDPEVLRFSNQRFRQHARENCLSYLATFNETSNYFLAIYERESGRMIGTMTAYVNENHGTADMGILVGDRAVWGRGMGCDAWCTLLTFLLNVRGLRKVTGGTLACNLGMIKVMERSGMRLEAVREAQEIVEGKPQDALYYAKFRDV
jgi:ribosomal-protein-alanine N-acetyltransferase